jgi:hypothetical protein
MDPHLSHRLNDSEGQQERIIAANPLACQMTKEFKLCIICIHCVSTINYFYVNAVCHRFAFVYFCGPGFVHRKEINEKIADGFPPWNSHTMHERAV